MNTQLVAASYTTATATLQTKYGVTASPIRRSTRQTQDLRLTGGWLGRQVRRAQIIAIDREPKAGLLPRPDVLVARSGPTDRRHLKGKANKEAFPPIRSERSYQTARPSRKQLFRARIDTPTRSSGISSNPRLTPLWRLPPNSHQDPAAVMRDARHLTPRPPVWQKCHRVDRNVTAASVEVGPRHDA
jgi:hypothetical protein